MAPRPERIAFGVSGWTWLSPGRSGRAGRLGGKQAERSARVLGEGVRMGLLEGKGGGGKEQGGQTCCEVRSWVGVAGAGASGKTVKMEARGHQGS